MGKESLTGSMQAYGRRCPDGDAKFVLGLPRDNGIRGPTVRTATAIILSLAALALESHIAAAGLASTIGYFDAFTSDKMPVNLIQAQRDYFGAHTYQRIDEPGVFHTEWNK